MNRDKSPKRRAKSADNFYTAFDIVKNYVRFYDLVRVYMAAKSLWSLFNRINVAIHSHTNVYIPTVQVWQQLLECNRYKELLDLVDIEIQQKRLPIVSAALRGAGVTDITRLFGVELLNQDMLYAAALNGSKAFFDKYVAFWEPHVSQTVFVLDRIPTFSGELSAAYKNGRGRRVTIYSLTEYLRLSIKHRLVSGLVQCNRLLRTRIWFKSPPRSVIFRNHCIEYCDKHRRSHILKLIPQCREWGHPKALRLITTFLEPMVASLSPREPCKLLHV